MKETIKANKFGLSWISVSTTYAAEWVYWKIYMLLKSEINFYFVKDCFFYRYTEVRKDEITEIWVCFKIGIATNFWNLLNLAMDLWVSALLTYFL